MKQLYALIESPKLLVSNDANKLLFSDLGIQMTRFSSARQFNKAISKQRPDIVIAEFFYGFGSNYAGINISNLDVSLYALQRYAPDASIIILANKTQRPHTAKLAALFNIHQNLSTPINNQVLQKTLKKLIEPINKN